MKKLILFMLLFAALLLPAQAREVEDMQADSFGVGDLQEAMPDTARDILGDYSITDSVDLDGGLGKILDAGEKELDGAVRSALKRTFLLLAIVMLCAVVSSIRETELGGFPPLYLSLAAAMAITAVSVGSMKSFVGLGTDTVSEIMMFSKSLLPTMAAAMAATGKTLAASATYVAASLFCDLFITLTSTMIVPLVYIYITAAAAAAAVDGDMLARMAALVKWVITTLMKVLLVCFIAYLSISGIISGSVDSAAIRAAKVALSSTVPVVGSIISDASETVLVSASILKNAIGVFGMLSVLAVCVVPFLNLGVHYLAYKACAALASAIGGGAETKLIDAIGSALGLILAMTAVCALLLLVSCVSAMKAVAG